MTDKPEVYCQKKSLNIPSPPTWTYLRISDWYKVSGARLKRVENPRILTKNLIALLAPFKMLRKYLGRKNRNKTYLSSFLASVDQPAASKTSGFHIDFGIEPNFSYLSMPKNDLNKISWT